MEFPHSLAGYYELIQKIHFLDLIILYFIVYLVLYFIKRVSGHDENLSKIPEEDKDKLLVTLIFVHSFIFVSKIISIATGVLFEGIITNFIIVSITYVLAFWFIYNLIFYQTLERSMFHSYLIRAKKRIGELNDTNKIVARDPMREAVKRRSKADDHKVIKNLFSAIYLSGAILTFVCMNTNFNFIVLTSLILGIYIYDMYKNIKNILFRLSESEADAFVVDKN